MQLLRYAAKGYLALRGVGALAGAYVRSEVPFLDANPQQKYVDAGVGVVALTLAWKL